MGPITTVIATEPLIAGSYLVLSHLSAEPDPQRRAMQQRALDLYQHTGTPVTLRTADQIAALIAPEFELVPPGIVPATDWHPEPEYHDDPPQPTVLVALARKRQPR